MDKYKLLEQVSRANLERDVKDLATRWPTRHTLSKHHQAIVEHLESRFKELGYPPKRHSYSNQGRALFNVLTEKPGGTSPTILVCGHFDSRQEDIRAPEALAPGANDNATGVAVIFELARLLKNVPLRCPLRFVLFSGEEQNLWGSTAYAAECKSRGEKFNYIFNLDEVGYPDKEKHLFLDRDEGKPTSNNAASAKLIARMEALARTVVKVPTKIDPAEASDYMPFERLGYTITGLYEGEYRYPHYHKSTDTPDKVDFGYVADMARLSLALLLDEAR